MSNNSIDMLMVVARVLNRLPQPVIYTGGATIPLYLDALSARDMRPTNDVDCVVEVTSQREYYQLSATLRELGLSEDSSPGAPLCRWLCEGIKLDVMPIDPQILGFGNRWYERGVAESIDFMLPNGMTIRIFTIAYLLASKIEAFGSRGKNQFYFSKDFEDIITLLNGSLSLISEIATSVPEVKTFITTWIQTERKNLDAMAPAFLSPSDRLAGRDPFSKTFGMPPHAYQIQMRILQAKRLLRKEHSITSGRLLRLRSAQVRQRASSHRNWICQSKPLWIAL